VLAIADAYVQIRYRPADPGRPAAALADARARADAAAVEHERIEADLAARDQAAAGSHESLTTLRQRLADQSARVTDLERLLRRVESEAQRSSMRADEARRRGSRPRSPRSSCRSRGRPRRGHRSARAAISRHSARAGAVRLDAS
jgi:hypothetical protein